MFQRRVIIGCSLVILLAAFMLHRTPAHDVKPQEVVLRPVSLSAFYGPVWPTSLPTTTTTTEPPRTTTTTRRTTTTTRPPTRTTETPKETAPQGSSSTVSLIYKYFGSAGKKAVDVAQCESSLIPTNTNGKYWGIFQLGPEHTDRAAKFGYTRNDMLKAEPNIIVAADLYHEVGWGPWECA